MCVTLPDLLYEEALFRYRVRRYVPIVLILGFVLVVIGLLVAFVLESLFGIPGLGVRPQDGQEWLAIAVIGAGGIAVFVSSSMAEIRVTRRASIALDSVVPGRGGKVRWPNLLFGSPRVPARIDNSSVQMFRLKVYDPERTFPSFRSYRIWRAEFELSDGRVVSLDPSVAGLFNPLALDALIQLASRLKERGVGVEVTEAGRFHTWKRLDRSSS